MGNTLISHGGGAPEGYNVTDAGTRVATKQVLRKYWACTNSSDTPMYLALWQVGEGGVNTSVVGEGIYLAANGGSFELNNVNMYYDEIWAIHDSAGAVKRLCVQKGQ